MIFAEGDRADRMYVVLNGKVERIHTHRVANILSPNLVDPDIRIVLARASARRLCGLLISQRYLEQRCVVVAYMACVQVRTPCVISNTPVVEVCKEIAIKMGSLRSTAGFFLAQALDTPSAR